MKLTLLLSIGIWIPHVIGWANVIDQSISNHVQNVSSLNSDPVIALPDLPEPIKNDASLLPTQSGSLQFKGELEGVRFSIMQDFASGNEAPLDLDFATQQIPKTTLGWLVSSKANQTETVMNLGWRFGTNQQLLLSTAQLRGAVDLEEEGKQNPQANQLSGGVNYRYFIDKKWLTGLELSGYVSGSSSQFLSVAPGQGEALHYIAGSNLVGMRVGVETSPWTDVKLNIGVGSERVSYDNLSGLEQNQHLNTSVKWSQILLPTLKYNASVESNGTDRNLSTGIDLNLRNGHQLGVQVEHTRWNDGRTSDNAIKLAYTYQFGEKFSPFQTKATKAPWHASLVPEVLERPSYLPNSVLSKPDSSVN